MNLICQIDQTYLNPNKSIEKLSVSNCQGVRLLYIYNYKGNSFRIFRSEKELDDFWNGESEEYLHFQTEKELDEWLNNVDWEISI